MNINPSSELFLLSLSRKPVPRPTLFEPFLPRNLVEQLIWRRGYHLWDTPEHYTETMISLRERTLSDVVFLDTRPFDLDKVSCMLKTAEQLLPADSALVILCENEIIQMFAEASDTVCAIGGYGLLSPKQKPFIRMDNKPEFAIDEGASGYFASDNGYDLWQKYGNKISICGGLGAQFCSTSSPVSLQTTIESYSISTRNAGFLPGSGGTISACSYLEMISLLGGLIRLRPLE